jgi:hypothetical protein
MQGSKQRRQRASCDALVGIEPRFLVHNIIAED